MENSIAPSSKRTLKLPNPKWLPIVVAILAIWAITLGLWWRQLYTTLPAAPTPSANPTFGAVVGSEPRATPTPEGTPVTRPVVRQSGPLVQKQDWSALARAFDERRALADIAELSSPRYAGRAVGSPGGKLAAEWIAARFAEYGLQPAGDAGTYFQEFPVPYAELSAMPSLQIVDGAGKPLKGYAFRRDYSFLLGGYADGGQAEGPVLWVSNGAHADYNGLDAVGAVVLCRMPGAPQEVLRQALEHGAKAVLLARLEPANLAMRRLAREDALLPKGIPTLIVGPQVVQDLLAGSGMTLDDLTIQYKSRPLATRVRINLPLQYTTHASGRNVLGVLPGSDPEASQQIVIIGAHYDHLGADPDGTVWGGANDNASGVAAMLEIARQWKEQGYVPQRTVLFAAWDGEENGLWGSKYYVEHPRYPLTSTVGMLALDMVGGGLDTLYIDSGGMVADQSLASAAQLGIYAEGQSMGRSDHAPFVSAGVPATLYIWWDGTAPGVVYHVPEDNVHNIEPAKLKKAGELADLVLFNLASEQAALQKVVTERGQAIVALDESALLRTVDPLDRELAVAEQAWIEEWAERKPAKLVVEAGPALIAGNVATSTLTVRYSLLAEESMTVSSFPAHWVRRDGRWYYAGPAWDQASNAHVLVKHLQQPAQAEALARQASSLYQRLVEQAGLNLPPTVTVRLYSDDSLLHTLEVPPPGYEKAPGYAFSLQDGIALSQPAALTTTLVEFALQLTGWPSATSSWLAQGLDDYWKAEDTQFGHQLKARYMPLLVQADADRTLWPVEGMPSPYTLASDKRELWSAQAWAMARYLLEKHSWAGLREPTLDGIEAWPTALLDPWRAAVQGIAETLAQRSKAVLTRDEAAFLATVDATNATLYQEERHWFADLQGHPVQSFALEGKLLSIQNSQALVELEMKYRLTEEGSTDEAVSWTARFVERDGHWLYADADMAEQRSEHLVLRYMNPAQTTFAAELLTRAERAYAQVSSDLDFHPTQPIEVKLYDSSKLFRTSVYLSMPPAHSWTEPGESIKLVDMDVQQAARAIAHELSHTALFAKGVQHGSLHEGTGQYEAGLFDPAWQAQQVIKWRQQVYDLVRSARPISFATLTDWRQLKDDERSLIYNVGWDVVTYFRRRYGRETFLRWLDLLGSGVSFEDAFLQATGTTYADFDTAWRESVLRGHIDPQDIQTALTFDGERALQHVRTLAQPAWAGREAGTPGNQAAAQYIAERFAEYGLQPAGDEGTYFQHLVISQTGLITTPMLALLDESGQPLQALRYRVDFYEFIRGYAGSGRAEGEIIYVHNAQLADMRLGQRVLLTEATGDPARQAQSAYEHGASALLLASDHSAAGMAFKSAYLPTLETHTIPVCLLSADSFEALLQSAGYESKQLKDVPPALSLSLKAEVDVQLAFTPSATIANVLGVLPGSDPQLAQEVIIVGAHLDHLGSLPDGTIYPGANDDASGVGVLLEIARLWHERDYRPRRTVLFAAWNAEEMGLLGSAYYVAHPVYPLEKTRAMLQLDMVGRGRGYYISVAADEAQDALIMAHLDNAARQVEGRVTFDQYLAGSDHDSFHRRGIPAVMLAWERTEGAHLPGDTADSIDLNKLRATGRVTALALMTMCDDR